MLRTLLFVPLAASLLCGCDDPVTQDQIDQFSTLSTQRTQAAEAQVERLTQAALPALALQGPLAPRPDLGACDHGAAATLKLKPAPWPQTLRAATRPEAEAELKTLSERAQSPQFTATHLLVPAYEMAVEPTMDPERKGFNPGVGRARVAVVDVGTGEVVCLGTSGVRVTTTDLKIKRRAVAGGLLNDLTPEQRHQAAIEESQVLVVEAFQRQMLEAAREALAQAGPPVEGAERDEVIDPKAASEAVNR